MNLRLGGTTHPYQTLVGLTGGRYDPYTASFTTHRGHPRHYIASDHLEVPQLPALGQSGLLTRAARGDMRFDKTRGRGVVFHMLSSIEALGTVGVTAIADTPQGADDLYAHVNRVLARSGESGAPIAGGKETSTVSPPGRSSQVRHGLSVLAQPAAAE